MGDWRELFGYFNKLRLSQIIIQWSAIDNVAFYPSPYYRSLPRPPLKTILDLADEYRIDVFIGLAYDTQYWRKINGEPKTLGAHFKHFYERSVRVADELSPLVTKHPSFQGWYIAEEIDDINWRTAEDQQILFKYLQRLSQRLHTITPDKRVALSGFSNAALSPADFQSFWLALLGSADIDVVLFQDGIGVNKLQIDNLPRYLASINKAASAAGAELQVVIETFTQIAGIPIDKRPFHAIPAPLERIVRQISIAAQYSEKNVAFSIPEYMTPKGGPKAEQLYERYIADVLTQVSGFIFNGPNTRYGGVRPWRECAVGIDRGHGPLLREG